jgi:cytochrome c553
MKIIQALIFLVIAITGPLAWADPADDVKSPGGLGSKGYVWNKLTREYADILRLTGDFTRGKVAFSGCRGCHRTDGAGRPDGTYPRLTGQHASVIIKQVTDTRAGLRVNPKMLPFATEHAISLQEIADIADYLSKVQTAAENGKGPGTNLARGKQVYESNRCQRCHGLAGEGDPGRVFPVVAAQHYTYTLLEMQHVKDGSRSNGHPDMSRLLKLISREDMEAIADYLSRMPDYRIAITNPSSSANSPTQ